MGNKVFLDICYRKVKYVLCSALVHCYSTGILTHTYTMEEAMEKGLKGSSGDAVEAESQKESAVVAVGQKGECQGRRHSRERPTEPCGSCWREREVHRAEKRGRRGRMASVWSRVPETALTPSNICTMLEWYEGGYIDDETVSKGLPICGTTSYDGITWHAPGRSSCTFAEICQSGGKTLFNYTLRLSLSQDHLPLPTLLSMKSLNQDVFASISICERVPL
jgi:hypothetical protein